MPPSIADLPWLPAAPADFAARCRAMESPGAGAALQALAGFRLGARDSLAFSRALRRRQASGDDLAPLSPLRLVVLANATFDFIADHLPPAAARHGVSLELVLPPFDQAMQQALDPASELARADADAVLLALDHRWYGLERPVFAESEMALTQAVSRLTSLLEALRRGSRSTLIISTVASPPTALFGSFDALQSGTPRAMIGALNEAIAALAAEQGMPLLDTAVLAARVGTDRWFDPVQHLAYKLPFAAELDAIYADSVGRLLGAIRGKARKCLVLDLDNTVWGGAVGDDGAEALVLGVGTARGEAFLGVQRLALDLRERGVILAVSTKNDEAVARAAFEGHPEMALKVSDLALFQANWLDKASNLEAIARHLNIGLDALVLLDDNPAERAQVRAALPMVAVPELPADPAWFPWFLANAGYFEAVAFSVEDRLRAGSYAAETKRAQVIARSRDLGDYLSALEMILAVAPFDPMGRARIAQLINKTNQFNLTSRRYSEAEVAAMETNPAIFTLQVRLEDRFGDLGMIGVVVCKSSADQARTWEIDTWLMSCRALGRRVEEAMLAEVVTAARRRGIDRLVGLYRPTAKNGIVADHYLKLGFVPLSPRDDAIAFSLELAAAPGPPLPFRIRRETKRGPAAVLERVSG